MPRPARKRGPRHDRRRACGTRSVARSAAGRIARPAAAIENGPEAAREWLRKEGHRNIVELNEVLKETATSWKNR